jgi:hypothetical protein
MTQRYINREHPICQNVRAAQNVLQSALTQIYRTPRKRSDGPELDRAATMLSNAIGHVACEIRNTPACWITTEAN